MRASITASLLLLFLLPASCDAATPKLTRVGASVKGLNADFIAVAPDGTAYVNGGENAQRIWVFSPGGHLERTYLLPKGGYVGAYGNGQLYITEPPNSTLAGDVFEANPTTGAFDGMLGSPGLFDATLTVVSAPSGDIYVSADSGVQIPDPTDPESITNINAIMEFDPSDLTNFPGMYSSYVVPDYPGSTDNTLGEPAVSAVNSAGDLLVGYGDESGEENVGTFAPQGGMLGHFSNDPPAPQIHAETFAPGGNSILAAAEVDGTTVVTKATTYIEKVSFSGKVLERFGTLHLTSDGGDSFNSFGAIAVAPNGDGWVSQGLGGQLYRFKL